MRAVPFNITAYTPALDYDDNEIEKLQDQLQNVIDKTPKDILVVQGDWNAKVGKDANGFWQGICGPFYNAKTNKKGLRLLEFATFNDLELANTSGHHKAFRRWTWPKQTTPHHTDHILVRMHFRSGMTICRTQSFSGSDTGSVVSWCFEPSQPLGVTSGLDTSSLEVTTTC